MKSVPELNLTTILDRCQHVTVSMNSGSVLVVINCTQEKKSGAPSYPQEKGTGALLISGERNWCSTVFRSRELVHYCSQEKETCAILFSGEKLVHYCSQEEETSALLFLG